MNVSEKLKQARATVKLSQDEVAEIVGVSRQTISNWENGKSYPDIGSVVALSDVYSVTLDSLLKGDNEMVRHLRESTDVAKSNRQVVFSLIILMLMGIGYFLLLVLSGTLGTHIIITAIIIIVAYLIIMIVLYYFEREVSMFILGFGIVLLANILLILSLGGNVLDYVDFVSLLMIVIPLLAVLTATRSYNVFFGGLKVAFSSKQKLESARYSEIIALFRLLSKIVALSALLGILVNLVSISRGLDFSYLMATDQFAHILSREIGFSLVPAYIALLLILSVFEPTVYILKKHSSSFS